MIVVERKIETEEQYRASIDWLIEKAKLIEHPLLSDEERAKLEKKYDYVSRKVDEYKERTYDNSIEFWGIEEELKRMREKEKPKKAINLADFIGG